jgi:hypothetical protein
VFRRLGERGYGDILIARYPSLRKYFADFVQLPFEAKPGSEPLLKAINLVRHLDNGTVNKLPDNAPMRFIPKQLRRSLKANSTCLSGI